MKWVSFILYFFINANLCLQSKYYDATSVSCSEWELYHKCSCQPECHLFKNCCLDLANRNVSHSQNISAQSCTKLKIGYYIALDKCLPSYPIKEYVSRCENSVDEDYILKVPAFGKVDKRLYKNLFCALCNDQEYILGKSIYECDVNDITYQQLSRYLSNGTCTFYSFDVPDITFINNLHECLYDISNCSIKERHENRSELCETNSISLASSNKYRHCALCSALNTTYFNSGRKTVERTYPLTIIFDHSSNILQYINAIQESVDTNRSAGRHETILCNSDLLFDVYQNQCRSVFFYSLMNCIAVRLSDDEYYLNDEGLLYLNKTQRLLNRTEFSQDTQGISICIDKDFGAISKYAISESYITFIGLTISVPALLITIVTYLCIPELRTLPGKFVISLLSSLLLAEVLFLISRYVPPYTIQCILTAVLMHYSFLASFFWMNVISFDACCTFSGFMQFHISNQGNKKLLPYSIYAWISPLIIVTMSLLLEYIPENKAISPAYGKGICWITNGKCLLLVFGIPVIILLILNILAFIFISRGLRLEMKRSAKYLISYHNIHFQIFFKLSLVMGLTWILGFLYTFTKISEFSLLFCICNSFLGLFVCFSFLSTRIIAKKCLQFGNFSNISTFYCTSPSASEKNIQ
ncbi:probable G-protein coupled receptor Mth-like 11 [Octopus sinensis]|uniref:Probable G-protein coupled receptor Mth-like 11 n=1 Tax=Octopus sinensis TaxID=2607531 RepID=A0A7E6F559_9MOLL|nr:probable G-protein coupled receptor Mth-like 11 [Octopus sinensis]